MKQIILLSVLLCIKACAAKIIAKNATLMYYSLEDSSIENIKYSKLAVNSSVTVSLVFTKSGITTEKSRNWFFNGKPLTVEAKKEGEEKEIYSEDKGDDICIFFNKPSVKIAGEYKLVIKTDNDKEEFAVGSIGSPPIIESFSKSKRGLQGDEMTIVCKVEGYPLPTTVDWDRETAANEGDPVALPAGIQMTNSSTIANDSLRFPVLEFADAGVYSCNVTNMYGSDKALVQLRVKDRLAALWPFIGIVIEVVVLVTAILLYEKKRASAKKTDDEDDAGDQTAEPKDKAVDGKDEDVRQRGAVKA